MRILYVALVALSILIMLGSVGALTQATQGVGGIALALLFGVWARLVQASIHHKRTPTPTELSK